MKRKFPHNIASICIMTSVHHVFDVRIFNREARTLSDAGYKVTLIAPRIDGNCPNTMEILFLEKPTNRISRMLIFPWQIFMAAKRLNAVIYHFHDPELIPVGIALRLWGKRVIYDVHEDFPEQVLSKRWIPNKFRGMVSWTTKQAEMTAAALFSAIIAASEKISNRLAKYNKNTILVRNYPKLDELTIADQIPLRNDPKYEGNRDTAIVSLGGVNPARCVQEIVQAVGLLPPQSGIKLVIAGASSSALLEQVKSLPGWKRTCYLGQLPRIEALSLLKRSHIALVIYSPSPNHYEVRSNRLFESMAAGIPVITSNFPGWKEVVEGADCGLCVDPLSPPEIAEAILWLTEHPAEAARMGMNGRKAVTERYNWENEAKALSALYQGLVNEL